ncbi:hypothetical protein GGD92_16150 [Pseudomonas protegens]|uniref:Uncharacterized protein n=1 Tax=Pseudomonas protegens TaxID=380021 RepID=A0A7G8YE33_9PSED|nr:hypothetical protein [Pseudomonas protegens]QNH79700.1 hypothetical protein GGI48_11225 [Pseudomonas protegens]QNL03127.1 hypothetical protein GGD92_16150 [Pseudomonas protegens]
MDSVSELDVQAQESIVSVTDSPAIFISQVVTDDFDGDSKGGSKMVAKRSWRSEYGEVFTEIFETAFTNDAALTACERAELPWRTVDYMIKSLIRGKDHKYAVSRTDGFPSWVAVRIE